MHGANQFLPLCLQYFTIPFLIFCFGFVEEQFGEDALVGHVEDGIPFGDVAGGEGVYGVDIFKFFKSLYSSFFFQH